MTTTTACGRFPTAGSSRRWRETAHRVFAGDGGPATSAQLRVQGVAVDGAANIYVAGNNRVRKVSTSGIITTVAGNVQLSNPSGVAVDGAGNLFFAEVYLVRKVATS